MGEHVWSCENRHSFDVARQGHVNLLPVTRKHSLHPGDTREMVVARKRFLDGGYYSPIAQKLCALLSAYSPDFKAVLDAGCGEGYYLGEVEKQFPAAELWGLDISKDAVRFASVRSKKARWITGTAAQLPFGAAQFDAVLSMFALTAEEEFRRVLKDSGVFLQVLAGEEHLIGLKSIIYPEILRREKFQEKEYEGFLLEHHEVLEFPVLVEDSAQLQNLLAMTPHFWRISEAGALRLRETESLADTAQVVFNIYRKK